MQTAEEVELTEDSPLLLADNGTDNGTETMKELNINDQSDPFVQYMYELIDVATLGVCFEIHRSIRLGSYQYEMMSSDEEDEEFTIINKPGLDVFGQLPAKKLQECTCPKCERSLAANRFAPHLEKCMGMGRNSSRIASRRLQTAGQMDELDTAADAASAGVADYEWSYEFDKKTNRKTKIVKTERDGKSASSPRRTKIRKMGLMSEFSVTVPISTGTTSGSGSRPGTPTSTGSGDLSNGKAGPTLAALESLSREEKRALLTQTCGAISEKTGKMCTRTGKCSQHTDEQRRTVRERLLGEAASGLGLPWQPSSESGLVLGEQDDVHIEVDGFEDIDGGPLLRDLTQLSWEQESNVSTGSEGVGSVAMPTLVTVPSTTSNSPVIMKKTSKKNRKGARLR